MQDLRANTQVIVTIGPFVDVGDGFTPQTDIDITGTNEAELLKHGSTTVVDISGATWAAVANCRGYYSLTLTTSHTNTEGMLEVIIQDDSDCLPVRKEFMVLSEAAWDSLYVAKDDGFMDVNIKTVGRADTQETEANNLETACANHSATRGLAGTALPAVAGGSNGGIPLVGSQVPNANADAAGGLPISDAGDLDLDTLMGRLDATVSSRNATTPPTVAAIRAVFGIAYATVEDNGNLSDELIEITGMTPSYRDSAASPPAFVDGVLFFLDGTCAGEQKRISGFEGLGSDHWEISLNSSLSAAPSVGDHCILMPTTAAAWNTAWEAEVQDEVNDALVAIHLDHLLAVAYDPASKPGAADALLNELVENDGGVSRFNANALEQAAGAVLETPANKIASDGDGNVLAVSGDGNALAERRNLRKGQ